MLVGFVTSLLMAVPSADAQERSVRLGWIDAPPFYVRAADGSRSGFGIELFRRIAELEGIDVDLVAFNTPRLSVDALVEGQIDALSVIAPIAALGDEIVVSPPVMSFNTRLHVRADEMERLDPATLEGARLGVVPPAAGSEQSPLLARNDVVEALTMGELVFGLLAGDVDGFILGEALAFDHARRAGVDHRIVAVGEPLSTFNRVIAMRPELTELHAKVANGIQTLDASGELEQLRQQWLGRLDETVPDALVVGTISFPPYQIITEDGGFTGFGVELLRDLAERLGLRLRFVEVAGPSEAIEALATGTIDLMSGVGVTTERAELFDFSTSFDRDTVSLFMRGDRAAGIGGLDDLDGARVGVQAINVGRRVAEAHGGLDVVVIDRQWQRLVAMLRDGEVDAVVYSTGPFTRAIANAGLEEELTIVGEPVRTFERAIALRKGLGPLRERLNTAMSGYLASDTYGRLRRDWLQEPVFWTWERIQILFVAMGGVVAATALGIGVQAWRQRRGTARQALARREMGALVDKLELVFDAATNGIVGLTQEKQVIMANTVARHMLGGLSQPTPFAWPDEIRFLDRDDLHPLDVSADPLERALAGQTLRGETHVMTRAKGGTRRYVRISSARVDDLASSIGIVVGIDDVSNDEFNRQQTDRSRRLDALGQLTGGIAHEFNNLLATLQYSIELSLLQDVSEKPARYLRTALGAVQRGAELTARLLAFAKQQPQLAKSRLVDDALGELMGLARPTIEEVIDVRTVAADHELWVFCDQGQLANALLNLVLNSRDAIMRSGVGDKIIIRARSVAELDADPTLRSEGPGSYIGAALDADEAAQQPKADDTTLRYIEFSVTDNGPGMSEEVRRRAVDPFFSTKDAHSGTGLGLSMVYGFVQQSDGELRIYSEEGHGTTVRLLLPRGTAAGAREAPIERAPRGIGKGELVLLVEDEPNLLRLVDDLVESLGYRTVTARSGREAITLVDGGLAFDLLLTDIVMPGGVGGFDLARQLRRRRPNLPVIYMSGYTGFTTEEMGDVVAPLLAKPCPPAELANAIKSALTSRPDAA